VFVPEGILSNTYFPSLPVDFEIAPIITVAPETGIVVLEK
jgi:hypothetical protein